MVHMIHHQLFSSQLLNHSGMKKNKVNNGEKSHYPHRQVLFSCLRSPWQPNWNFLCIRRRVAGLVIEHNALKGKTDLQSACYITANYVTGEKKSGKTSTGGGQSRRADRSTISSSCFRASMNFMSKSGQAKNNQSERIRGWRGVRGWKGENPKDQQDLIS